MDIHDRAIQAGADALMRTGHAVNGDRAWALAKIVVEAAAIEASVVIARRGDHSKIMTLRCHEGRHYQCANDGKMMASADGGQTVVDCECSCHVLPWRYCQFCWSYMRKNSLTYRCEQLRVERACMSCVARLFPDTCHLEESTNTIHPDRLIWKPNYANDHA